MTPLTLASDAVTARILAARLGAAGVTWELRGNHGGPYPVGPVEILVARDDVDLARALLAEATDADDLAAAAEAAMAVDTDPTDPADAADTTAASRGTDRAGARPATAVGSPPLAGGGRRLARWAVVAIVAVAVLVLLGRLLAGAP